MRLNSRARTDVFTHEGAPAKQIKPIEQLRRSVLACMLWENEFYEGGQTIADRIMETARQVSVEEIAALAMEARHTHNIRHASLLLLCALIEKGRGSTLVSHTIEKVISRADELTELPRLYWEVNKSPDLSKPLANQLKKGLDAAFRKFDAYQFAKYDRDDKVKLSDVLRIVRPRPADDAQAALFKGIRDRSLPAPDTWEVALSGGADKKETFERLLRENRLGYMALLRNLRNMTQAGVDDGLIREKLLERRGANRVLPFRFVAAARIVPQFERELDQAMCANVDSSPTMEGETTVLVDVSGSMDEKLSARSDLKRIDAAAALASIINGRTRVFSFSQNVVEVPPRRGMAGIDAIITSQRHAGTFLGQAVEVVMPHVKNRLIVITDEQSADRVPDPTFDHAYIINVASAKNGVGYGKWIHLDGFSENIIRYIQEIEANHLG